MEGSEIFMRPEEAQIGLRVRVRGDHRKTSFRGQEGIIVKRWGNPAYPALDVSLEDGDWQLFWYYELEQVDEDDHGAQRQSRATVVPYTQVPSPYSPSLLDAFKV
jgi:hypothetical protein